MLRDGAPSVVSEWCQDFRRWHSRCIAEDAQLVRLLCCFSPGRGKQYMLALTRGPAQKYA